MGTKRCREVLAEVDGEGVVRYSDKTRKIAEIRAREHGKASIGTHRRAQEDLIEIPAFSDERSKDIAVIARYFNREIDLKSVVNVLFVCDCQEADHGQHLQDNLIGIVSASIRPYVNKPEVTIDRLERVDPMSVLGDFQFDDEADPTTTTGWSESYRRQQRAERERNVVDIRNDARNKNSLDKP